MDVGTWLRRLGLEQYEAAFRENDVNAELLPNLTGDDLKDLGITSVGHRRQVLQAIATLRPETTLGGDAVRFSAHPPTRAADSLISPETTAERRPLSVMFCDLVGSTALSSRLDPEDLRDVIRAYQGCVATTIQQFHGFVARYVGDAVLIYFGWPEAGETDAERAVRAGLAVVAAVSTASAGGERLHVRVGIATGLVVIGEPIGSGDSRQQTAVGETPNRAARLQGLAGPNQVIIDAATRRQIGGLFECNDLGATELKGLPAAVPAWQVVSENRTLGQFEALRSGATPLVGRDDEIEFLLRHWHQAKAGKGRVVLISADPGVGKSRLAKALTERIAADPHTRLGYFCSPHHQDSALYPVVAQMERAAGFAQTDAPIRKRDKLQAMLAAATTPVDDMALIADLHGLPSADLAAPFEGTPQRKKDKTFNALIRHGEALARRQPLLVVFDDIHWIDPSSCEFIGRVIEQITDSPMLLLALFRPEFQPPWVGQPHVTTLTLDRLGRRDTAAMVATIAGNTALPPDIVEEIAERTDGVPLFVEELTKSVLESGPPAPSALSAIPHAGLTVPATLHASLMARLDRLGPAAKEVAQTGAAIGREFGHELLAATTDLPEPQLRDALDRLKQAGLLLMLGTPPAPTYMFKHALVQDAAYGTLLRTRRQGLHARIGATLDELFSEIAQAQPALLARHYAAAGLAEKAVVYWLMAGRQALACSAMAEAVAQLRKGLHMLASLADGPVRQQQELDLQTALVSALTATSGWPAADVNEALTRARALAEQLDRPESLVQLFMSQCILHATRSEHRLALALSEQFEQIGAAGNNTTSQFLGRFSQGLALLELGEFGAARAILERCHGLADPAHRSVGAMAIDPYAAMLTYLAMTLACLGYIDQARSRMDEALSEARRLKQDHTIAHLLVHTTWLDWLTRSPLVHLEECLALTTEQGFPFYFGWALAYHGLSLLTLGHVEEACAALTRALAELRGTEGTINTPMPLTWLAEAYAMLGQGAEERTCLAEAAHIIQTRDERLFEAELLYRIPGDLLKAAGDRIGAERKYRRAIEIAERQRAKLFQLRASVSLARLWYDQSKRTEAHKLLDPIYNWFTEGFDAADLKDAKALLDDLAKN